MTKHILDITEIMDGYKQDMLDLLEVHREYIAKTDNQVKEVMNLITRNKQDGK